MGNRFLQPVTIASTDLTIPYATVGTMMFGKRADAAESQRILDIALDHGLNFFDTADMYQDGESERLLGKAVGQRRDQCIIATKVGYGKNEQGEEEGLSPEALRFAIDRSLRNLGMDYVDIYYLHRPDYETPIEETLAALHELRQAGKIRHFGLSNFAAWQSLEVLNLCDANGWQRPVMAQMIYNLLVRSIEFEYVSFCRRFDVHLTVYNPLAGGLLTGKYASLQDESAGGRFVGDANYRNRYWTERFFNAMLQLKSIADAAGMSLTHLALAWIAQGEVADSILLGPSSGEQLLDCIAAGEQTIPEEVMEQVGEFITAFDGTDAVYAR